MSSCSRLIRWKFIPLGKNYLCNLFVPCSHERCGCAKYADTPDSLLTFLYPADFWPLSNVIIRHSDHSSGLSASLPGYQNSGLSTDRQSDTGIFLLTDVKITPHPRIPLMVSPLKLPGRYRVLSVKGLSVIDKPAGSSLQRRPSFSRGFVWFTITPEMHDDLLFEIAELYCAVNH